MTDVCDLECPGCYRHRLEGHRPVSAVKEDILLCQKLTNCDRMAISGGEPLLYPDLLDVVAYIRELGMKPVLLTNGVQLTHARALELRQAGLAKFHFHVDSGQPRPGWIGKNEAELNALRQHFADLCWDVGGVQCGFNITVFRSSLELLPEIVSWARENIPRVQHISLIAYRAIPIVEGLSYRVEGRGVDARRFQHVSPDPEAINITTEEMFAALNPLPLGFRPAVYLRGTADPETYKFLVAVHVGSSGRMYGYMGSKSVALIQRAYHLLKRRYFAFLENPRVGKKAFWLAFIDREMRRTLKGYIRACLRTPEFLWKSISVQTLSLQQPNEYAGGKANMCEGCLNMMVYRGKLIPSCRLDEYRIFGGPLEPVAGGEDS